MQSKQQDEAKSDISPVLFMSVDGEPMCFFLRPGSAKCKLQPLITAGGGVVCNVQQPGAILLIDPDERASVPQSTAHWYVSTHYIHDCIEKDVQLELEDYRLDPKKSESPTKPGDNKDSNPNSLGGRVFYTAEEDAAILSYVVKDKSRAGGIHLWQEMEEKKVTTRSWQSMKARYQKHLRYKQAHDQEAAGAEQITQIDVQPSPTESAQPENVEAGPSTSTHPTGCGVDTQTDVDPAQPEDTQMEPTEPQEAVVSEPEELTKGQVESPSDSSSEKKPDEDQNASRKVDQPQRQSVRRKLRLHKEPSPEFSGRKLRSSSKPPQQPVRRTKSAAEPPSQNAANADEPLPKRYRIRIKMRVAQDSVNRLMESPQGSSSTAQHDGCNSSLHNRETPLGILEMAAKEFGSSSESGDEAMDLSPPDGKGQKHSTPIKPCLTAEPAADTASSLSETDDGTQVQEKVDNPQTSTGTHPAETECPKPAGPDPVQSRAHQFIFDSESQEEGSQSKDDGNTPGTSQSQAEAADHAAFSLTQDQLDEDKQLVTELMTQTAHDLVCVTMALLRSSGDVGTARHLLSDPSYTLGPQWSAHDDSLLRSGDSAARQQLVQKYGEEEVAKRMVFLEVE
ncbi:telomeric repeat-binding factor 2-interacting protein 1 isoform X2 [Thalassophryne amazonica]|uniref:telomeric repeat-binding factor 2-interacting protein 1 isoform X2 n=1 Tax=Thalassophryne amazonica TaxID=390379 RepID=UPI0014716611|nr:telomeric repeat-binding factor 2-interacting protein 1 isoform X2 [Thalassophryne amazonica]